MRVAEEQHTVGSGLGVWDVPVPIGVRRHIYTLCERTPECIQRGLHHVEVMYHVYDVGIGCNDHSRQYWMQKGRDG